MYDGYRFKKGESYRGTRIGEIINHDTTQLEHTSVEGFNYIYTFTDSYSGYVEAPCYPGKDQTVEAFIEFDKRLFNKTGRHVEVIRTDNGEFKSQKVLIIAKKMAFLVNSPMHILQNRMESVNA